jgi:hypothetical protein
VLAIVDSSQYASGVYASAGERVVCVAADMGGERDGASGSASTTACAPLDFFAMFSLYCRFASLIHNVMFSSSLECVSVDC